MTEKGATSRNVYLPRGDWFDFWTEEKVAGGREVVRNVDLSIMPLYVRAGALIPLGPIKQYTEEKVDGPLSLQIYPGANGDFEVYEDDGKSFDFRRGAWTGIRFEWNDKSRRLSVRLAPGSRMRSPASREINVRLVPGKETKSIVFRGRAVSVQF